MKDLQGQRSRRCRSAQADLTSCPIARGSYLLMMARYFRVPPTTKVRSGSSSRTGDSCWIMSNPGYGCEQGCLEAASGASTHVPSSNNVSPPGQATPWPRRECSRALSVWATGLLLQIAVNGRRRTASLERDPPPAVGEVEAVLLASIGAGSAPSLIVSRPLGQAAHHR